MGWTPRAVAGAAAGRDWVGRAPLSRARRRLTGRRRRWRRCAHAWGVATATARWRFSRRVRGARRGQRLPSQLRRAPHGPSETLMDPELSQLLRAPDNPSQPLRATDGSRSPHGPKAPHGPSQPRADSQSFARTLRVPHGPAWHSWPLGAPQSPSQPLTAPQSLAWPCRAAYNPTPAGMGRSSS